MRIETGGPRQVLKGDYVLWAGFALAYSAIAALTILTF